MLLGVDVMVDILIVDMMDVLPQIGVRTIICGKLPAKTRDLRIDGAALCGHRFNLLEDVD